MVSDHLVGVLFFLLIIEGIYVVIGGGGDLWCRIISSACSSSSASEQVLSMAKDMVLYLCSHHTRNTIDRHHQHKSRQPTTEERITVDTGKEWG